MTNEELFNKIKSFYCDLHLYSKEIVREFFIKGAITREQCMEILGEETNELED